MILLVGRLNVLTEDKNVITRFEISHLHDDGKPPAEINSLRISENLNNVNLFNFSFVGSRL